MPNECPLSSGRLFQATRPATQNAIHKYTHTIVWLLVEYLAYCRHWLIVAEWLVILQWPITTTLDRICISHLTSPSNNADGAKTACKQQTWSKLDFTFRLRLYRRDLFATFPDYCNHISRDALHEFTCLCQTPSQRTNGLTLTLTDMTVCSSCSFVGAHRFWTFFDLIYQDVRVNIRQWQGNC